MSRSIAAAPGGRDAEVSGAAPMIFRVLLTLLALALPPAADAAGAPLPGSRGPGLYDFGGASAEAVALYRRGWIEILEYGRWTEAERLYREAVAKDPNFLIAKSVLARITRDPAERDALFREVQANIDAVDAHGQLLLRTYQATLELFARREAGGSVPAAHRSEMAQRAVRDYGDFLRSYPREWSVVIEYIEWVHALSGPAAALAAVDRLRRDGERSFSYFPAWFHAELGNGQRARELAARFTRAIDDPTSPQPHYIRAFVAFEAGEYEAARDAIAQALALDPRHLLAGRLRREIEAAQAEEGT